MIKQKVVVIGAGINGLVAANYLQKGGCEVTLIERKERVGGTCAFETYNANGKAYTYPSAATVFGFMQDFVLQETGLARRLSFRAPEHPPVIWFESKKEACYFHDDISMLKKELRKKWGEEGDIAGYYRGLERVRDFLIRGYRNARVPTIRQAEQELGEATAQLWIAGSARQLMDHFFSSDAMKVYCSIEVTERGPVSLDSPYSAFSIPLMRSGSIFDGDWGFVKGGLWKVAEELAEINKEFGVRIVTSAEVLNVLPEKHQVKFQRNGHIETMDCDRILFATDPFTAARLLGETELISQVGKKKALGTSGKLIMLFDRPIRWQDDTGEEDFDSAFKFIISANDLDAIEKASKAVVGGTSDFVPGYFELYCEGAGMRSLGAEMEYEVLTVFFKNLAFSKRGEELPEIKQAVESIILAKIKNRNDLVASILLTPKDLSEKFFLPEGNIDHVELLDGQTFFARNYSPHPEQDFYQFGSVEGISYCAAGSYPCGSIAGTSGYLCARQLIKSKLIRVLS